MPSFYAPAKTLARGWIFESACDMSNHSLEPVTE